MHTGTDPMEPHFAPITVTADGTTQLVAAVAGQRIRVTKYYLRGAAASVTFKSGSTALTGPMRSGPLEPATAAGDRDGLFETAAGEALNLTAAFVSSLDAAALGIAGHLTYLLL